MRLSQFNNVNNTSASEVEKALNEEPTSQIDEMVIKIAAAERMGVELARDFEKEAMLPVLGALAGGAARLMGGKAVKGIAGGIAKDMAVGAVGNKLTSAMKPAAGQASSVGGGFKYAGIAGSLATAGRQATGFLHRNPGAAVTLGGAAVGAVMAPRDPQTGQKQMLRGAVMGGGLAAGANALSKGQLADKAKHMVTRQNNPIFGQGARRYATESAYATRPGATGGPVNIASGPGYRGGPTTGTPKLASVVEFVKQAAASMKK